jgi:hypothetical protein
MFRSFYVFISVILFICSVKVENALKCFFMSVALFMGQLSVLATAAISRITVMY